MIETVVGQICAQLVEHEMLERHAEAIATRGHNLAFGMKLIGDAHIEEVELRRLDQSPLLAPAPRIQREAKERVLWTSFPDLIHPERRGLG